MSNDDIERYIHDVQHGRRDPEPVDESDTEALHCRECGRAIEEGEEYTVWDIPATPEIGQDAHEVPFCDEDCLDAFQADLLGEADG